MTPGTKLGVYEILAPLGAGGMGEVYRARDTKLKRDVALKVLPDAFARDPGRMARFQREAEVLASLNHPNIAAIYGVEERALVMELVEGESPKGPMPFDEAWKIASQMAAALEYAHDKGVVHRDLKPANIKVTHEGVVKLLDFGLAKAFNDPTEAESGDPANSPTIALEATVAGTLLGTAAYMAPEQAKGKRVDRRADIWAWGVVLFELLTGERLFQGEDASDTLAQVLTKQPDLQRVPANARRLLQECLQKDPKLRLRDIGDAKRLLDDNAIQAPSKSKTAFAWSVAAFMTVLAATVAFALRPGTPNRPLIRLDVDLGPLASANPNAGVAISPDGARIVFPARSPDGRQMLATRLLEQPEATLLAGTEAAGQPFFSPDGRWIGFFAEQWLKKVSVQGGAPVTIAKFNFLMATSLAGAAWGDDGYIIASPFVAGAGLFRISDSGGTPQPLVTGKGVGHRWPQLLPRGNGVLFTAATEFTNGAIDDATIQVVSLKTGQSKTLVSGGYFARYEGSSGSTGHLLYVRGGVIYAVPFDPDRLELRGTPVPLIQGVAVNPQTGNGQFDVSRSGTLVYRAGVTASQNRSVAWMDRSGKMEPLLKPGVYSSPRLSPDGQRLALTVNSGSSSDLWVYERARDNMTRLTFDGQARDALWTRDGRHILYWGPSDAGFVIRAIRADGAGEPQRLIESRNPVVPSSLSPDNRVLAYFEIDPKTAQDIWMLPLDWSDPEHPKPGKPELYLRTPFLEWEPAFSPDGRWIAYLSSESGLVELYVRPFPGPGAKWQISSGGGMHPKWSPAGRELFYESPTPDDRIMVVGYTANGDSFTAGKPRPWSDAKIQVLGGMWDSDVAPDGKRFVVFPPAGAGEGRDQPLRVTFLLNFFDELRRKAPASK